MRYFAFPFGLKPQLTPAAIATVQEAGFDGFCSAYGAYNLIGGDEFHLRRFHGDPEFARLVNWLSFDKRKADQEPAIHYDLLPADASSKDLVFPALSTSNMPTLPFSRTQS